MHRIPPNWLWRAALSLSVVAVALGGLAAGVQFSERTTSGHVLERLYYVVGLFLMGGIDLGVPTGGPAFARAGMWVAYFVAPAITVAALIEAVLRVIQPRWFYSRGYHDHVVVVGLGQLGSVVLDGLRHSDPTRMIVVVDRDASLASKLPAKERQLIRFLRGDIRASSTIEQLKLDRAKGVVLATGSNLTNFEAAFDLKMRASHLSCVAHVGDDEMLREAQTILEAKGHGIRLFSSHELVAAELYRSTLAGLVKAITRDQPVVVAGFGRFGQTIVELLEQQSRDDAGKLVIVDRAAMALMEPFEDRHGKHRRPRTAVDGEIAEPSVWRWVEAALEGRAAEATYIFGTPNDTLNLEAAMAIRRQHGEARIFVRCARPSALTSLLAEHYRLRLLSFEETLQTSIRADAATWFAANT